MRVAQWLATSAQKPKVPDSSPTATDMKRLAVCSNRPANVYASAKRMEVV